jgi:hypothetical protein
VQKVGVNKKFSQDRMNAISLGDTNSRNGFSGFFFNSFLQSESDLILLT